MPDRPERSTSHSRLRLLRIHLRACRRHPGRAADFLLWSWTRYVLCWLVTLGVAGGFIVGAWICFNDPQRADGSWGHATMDFGGQWVFARMILEGHGRHLYDRNYLRMVAEEHYPVVEKKPAEPTGEPGADSGPPEPARDADSLLAWMMGTDDENAAMTLGGCALPLAASSPIQEAALLCAGPEVWSEEHCATVVVPHVGGPLYPPIHALLFAPLSSIPPRTCYRIVQMLNLLLMFLAGWVISRMTRGRVWWPIATLGLMIFPGFGGSMDLGQNATLSLTFVLLGWWQLMRGRPVLAGVLWSLLAYKAVWAASFFLVPVLTARWRMALSMALGGLVQIVLTLPVVGGHSWLEWIEVGRIATWQYTRQENWIILSRDLQSLPRRWLLTFEDEIAVDPENPLANRLALGVWLTVCLATLALVLLRRKRIRQLEGPYVVFLLLGVYFSCFHFMYYDVMLAVLPICLLFTDPGRYLRPIFWPRRPADPALLPYFQPRLRRTPGGEYSWHALFSIPPVPLLPGGGRFYWVLTPAPPLLLFFLIVLPGTLALIDTNYRFPPLDTACLLLLWLWSGARTGLDGMVLNSWHSEQEETGRAGTAPNLVEQKAAEASVLPSR